MALRVCVLGSGSSGNCTYVSSGDTSILVDAGLTAKETDRRLQEIGASLIEIQGICLSHEHGDHTSGIRTLHRKYSIPLYANAGTIEGMTRNPDLAALPWNVFSTGSPFGIGTLSIEPFSVSHDAYEPVGFTVSAPDGSVGIVTDMGVATALVRERLRGCNGVVIESNHDEQLLADAERPWSLKQRIRGRQGHLSNQHAAEVMAEIAGPGLRQVFLAHLSEECNRPELALNTTRNLLSKAGHTHIRVSCAYPNRVSEVWTHPAP